MTLFAPDKQVESSVSQTSTKQFDPELSKAIHNTIDQIKSNPYDMRAIHNSLEGLTVTAQNLQKNDIGGNQTVTTNSSQIGANVESLQAKPATQDEVFEKQMRWREQQEREALFVASQVIRHLEELDPARQINSKVESKTEKDIVKPTPTPEDRLLDPEAHKKLMGDINVQLEKLGILVNPNKAFLESTIVIEDDLKLAAAKELGIKMPWKEASGLSTKDATTLAESLNTINGLKQESPLQATYTQSQEQSLANPIPNVATKENNGISLSTQETTKLTETLNTINGLKEDAPLQATYTQGQTEEVASMIPNTSKKEASKPLADPAKAFMDALSRREGVELALSKS